MPLPTRMPARFLAPRTLLIVLATLAAPMRAPVSAQTSAAAPVDSVLLGLREDAAALDSLVQSPLANRFIAATADLPSRAPRKLHFDSTRTHFYNETEFAALSEAEQAPLKSRELSEQFYFTTRYGTPLAYARPLEILAEAGLRDVA